MLPFEYVQHNQTGVVTGDAAAQVPYSTEADPIDTTNLRISAAAGQRSCTAPSKPWRQMGTPLRLAPGDLHGSSTPPPRTAASPSCAPAVLQFAHLDADMGSVVTSPTANLQ